MNIIGGEKAVILIWAWPSLYRYLSYVSVMPAMIIHAIDMIDALDIVGAMACSRIDAMTCAMITRIS